MGSGFSTCGSRERNGSARTKKEDNFIVIRGGVLPELLLGQVELHVLVLLVLFVQLPQCCVGRLVARLLQERVHVLLGGPEGEAVTLVCILLTQYQH